MAEESTRVTNAFITDVFKAAVNHANGQGMINEFLYTFFEQLGKSDDEIKEAIRVALYEWDL